MAKRPSALSTAGQVAQEHEGAQHIVILRFYAGIRQQRLARNAGHAGQVLYICERDNLSVLTDSQAGWFALAGVENNGKIQRSGITAGNVYGSRGWVGKEGSAHFAEHDPVCTIEGDADPILGVGGNSVGYGRTERNDFLGRERGENSGGVHHNRGCYRRLARCRNLIGL